jgi:hypothetical protein
MAELVIQSGKHQGKRLSLPAGEVFVGRDEDCQIRLTSTDISRRHCVLQVSEADVRVRDLESRNGTFVNDVAVSGEVVLKPGDVLRVGPMVLQMPGTKVAPPAKTEVPRKENGHSDDTQISGGSRKPKKKASEDDIASWLAEEEEEGGSGDTTIVSGRAPKKAEPAPAAPAPRASELARSEKKAFHSVQEEAADIIRRHWEAKGRK